MLRHTLKLSLLALGLAAATPLAAQQRAPRAPRPTREWVAERPGRYAAVRGQRRYQRHMQRGHRANRAHRAQRARAWHRGYAYRGWRTI
jgi:hypothetical protein